MKPKILLVNPPIYDFAAYDFWLKPYGMLSIAGFLRDRADFMLFDYLDRFSPYMAGQKKSESDQWGRGRFYCRQIPVAVSILLILHTPFTSMAATIVQAAVSSHFPDQAGDSASASHSHVQRNRKF